MSAYICDDDLFIQLGAFAVARDIRPSYARIKSIGGHLSGDQLATAYANLLREENIRSVLHRYPQDTRETAPGPIDLSPAVAVTSRDIERAKKLSPIQVVKSCHCLDYQSCETDDWHSTEAFRLIAEIISKAARLLPGYEGAVWGAAA